MIHPTLVVAAVCFRNERGEVLTVRKRDTSAYMLPGGKLEVGESALAAAVREVSEEIGVELEPAELVLLGEYTASAANEADTSIDATIYLSAASIAPVASGEIVELRWVQPADAAAPHTPLAPLLSDWVFPALTSGVEEHPGVEFAFPGPLRDRLVAAILDGSKTSTTSTLAEYECEDIPLPVVGSRQTVLDSSNSAVATIETVSVEIARLADVALAHVRDEGEGHTSVMSWRAAHERFWHSPDLRAALGDPTFTVHDDTLVVLERFRAIR